MDRLELPIAGLVCSIVKACPRDEATQVPGLPAVRVVKGVDRHRPLRVRLRGPARSIRRAARDALAVMIGVWPLWLLGLFAFGLIWAFALGASP